MSRLLAAIDHVGRAADNLTRACGRAGAIVEVESLGTSPMTASLRRSYRVAAVTPSDMAQVLRRMK